MDNINLESVMENVDVNDVIDAATSLATTEVVNGGRLPKEAKYAIAVAGGIAVGVVAAEVIIPAVKERLPEPKKKRKEKDGDIIEVDAEVMEEDQEEKNPKKKSNNKKK